MPEVLRTGGRTLLVIDEAHHLNAECSKSCGCSATWPATTAGRADVLAPCLPCGTDRPDRHGIAYAALAVRPELHSLDESESADYVLHQLRWAGAKKPEKLFDADTLHLDAARERHSRC